MSMDGLYAARVQGRTERPQKGNFINLPLLPRNIAPQDLVKLQL
jgi:hypothetical protein